MNFLHTVFFSDEIDLLPAFTFGISGSLVYAKSPSSFEHCSIAESLFLLKKVENAEHEKSVHWIFKELRTGNS